MNAIRAGLACSLVSLLAACGGGGGGDEGALATTYPSTGPTAGDWYSYTQTTQRTVPSASTSTYNYTRLYGSVGADGSGSYRETSAESTVTTTVFDSAKATISYGGGCSYSPAYRANPPLGASAGTTYSSSAARTCLSVPAQYTSATVAVTGKADGPERHTIPLGTFNTFKHTKTVTSTVPTETSVVTMTCWDDMSTGTTVECSMEAKTTPTGATSPSSVSTSRILLAAYGRSGHPAVGPAVRRFAGTWRVQFSGDDSGNCSNVRVAVDGAISGTCAFGGAGSYGVTGQIADNGAVTVNVNNGAQLTGTAGTPLAASGNWTLGNLRGSWTASHQ